jgi:hypothetical protein
VRRYRLSGKSKVCQTKQGVLIIIVVTQIIIVRIILKGGVGDVVRVVGDVVRVVGDVADRVAVHTKVPTFLLLACFFPVIQQDTQKVA